MAIQQISGQTVYVITGSGRDPRLQSSGQSWANAVSQQKYRIYEQAVKDSMLKMQQEGASYEAQMKAMTQYRKDLVDARTKLLELKEKTASELVKEQARANKAAQVRVSTTTRASTATTGGEQQILQQERYATGLENERDQALSDELEARSRANTAKTTNYLKNYQTEIAQYEQEVADTVARGGDPASVTLNIVTNNANAKAAAQDIRTATLQAEQYKQVAKAKDEQLQAKNAEIAQLRTPAAPTTQAEREFVPTTTYSRQTGYQPAVTPQDITTRQQSIDEQIAKIEKELQGLQTPTRDTRSLLERSGETAREILGQPNRTDRALEAQILGLSTLQGAKQKAELSMPKNATPADQMQHRRNALLEALGQTVPPTQQQAAQLVTEPVTGASAESIAPTQEPTISSNTVTDSSENNVNRGQTDRKSVVTNDGKYTIVPIFDPRIGRISEYRYIDNSTKQEKREWRQSYAEAESARLEDANSPIAKRFDAVAAEYQTLTKERDLPTRNEMELDILQGGRSSIRTAPYQTGYTLHSDNPLALAAYVYNTIPSKNNTRHKKAIYLTEAKQYLRKQGMDERMLEQYNKHLKSKIVQDIAQEVLDTSADDFKTAQALATQQEVKVGERTKEQRKQVLKETDKYPRKVVDTVYNPRRNASKPEKEKLYQAAINSISVYPNLTDKQREQAINYLVQKHFMNKDVPHRTESVQEPVQEPAPESTPEQSPLQSTTIEEAISQ